jgi:Ca2+-binding RTX toxin-like protein
VKVAVGSSDASDYGGPGTDDYLGTAGDDSFDGLGGDDALDGKKGNDELFGGNGDDVMRGADGDDILWGGGDNDRISGGSGNDVLIGGEGDDILNGAFGFDRVELSGNIAAYAIFQDKLGRLHIDDSVAGRDGNDVVSSIEEFNFGGTIYSFAEVLAII